MTGADAVMAAAAPGGAQEIASPWSVISDLHKFSSPIHPVGPEFGNSCWPLSEEGAKCTAAEASPSLPRPAEKGLQTAQAD